MNFISYLKSLKMKEMKKVSCCKKPVVLTILSFSLEQRETKGKTQTTGERDSKSDFSNTNISAAAHSMVWNQNGWCYKVGHGAVTTLGAKERWFITIHKKIQTYCLTSFVKNMIKIIQKEKCFLLQVQRASFPPRKQKIQTSHDDVVRNDVIMTSELKFEMPQHSWELLKL